MYVGDGLCGGGDKWRSAFARARQPKPDAIECTRGATEEFKTTEQIARLLRNRPKRLVADVI